jgi:hypothetical protein
MIALIVSQLLRRPRDGTGRDGTELYVLKLQHSWYTIAYTHNGLEVGTFAPVPDSAAFRLCFVSTAGATGNRAAPPAQAFFPTQ